MTSTLIWGFPGGSDGKVSASNAGDADLIPGLGRSPEERHGNPLQDSGLENSSHGRRGLGGCHLGGQIVRHDTGLRDQHFFSLAVTWEKQAALKVLFNSVPENAFTVPLSSLDIFYKQKNAPQIPIKSRLSIYSGLVYKASC